jgi:hypothetical protein
MDWIQDIQFTVPPEALHLQYAWENECCAGNCNRGKCLKLVEVRKQKCHLKYLLKRTKMEIKYKYIMLIAFMVFALHNERF